MKTEVRSCWIYEAFCIMIDAKNYEILFRENYSKLSDQARIIWWKGNELGYNDNIYTSDDLLHDLFFSLKTSVLNESLTYFNNLDHFFAMTYIRMKSLYYAYLKKKWKRSSREKMYFKNLGYTYEKIDILSTIFDYNVDEFDVNKFTADDVLEAINQIENEEHRRILLLKRQEAKHKSICKYFNYNRQELRNKLHTARKKLFKILVSKGIINSDVDFKKFVGETTKKGRIHRIVSDAKYLYNDYPFEKDYKTKIEFVIKKNKGKIDMDFLPEIIKYNEGHQLKKDNRTAINYALEKCIEDYSCFILDGVIYLK